MLAHFAHFAFVGSFAFAAACAQSPAAAFVPAPGSPLLAGPMAGRPVLADFDRDGDLDVVLACGTCCGSEPRPDSGVVMVLLNDGHGRLRALDPRGVAVGPSVRKIAVGDLDGDGLPDVVCAEHDSYAVTALRNTAGARLVPFAGSPFVAGNGPKAHTHEIALADLDGDGALDVLTTNANDHSIGVLRGDGHGSFASVAGAPFGTPWRHPYDALAIADFDGDGRRDVVAPLLRDGRIALLRGDGSGALRKDRGDVVAVSARPGSVCAVDVDRDGDLDVVATHDDTGVLDVLTNDGKGTFAARAFDLGTPLWGIAAGDLDGDGIADLALGAQNGSDVLLARGSGTGGFTAWQTLHAGAIANYAALGDLDGDGVLDVVVSCYGSGEVCAFLAR